MIWIISFGCIIQSRQWCWCDWCQWGRFFRNINIFFIFWVPSLNISLWDIFINNGDFFRAVWFIRIRFFTRIIYLRRWWFINFRIWGRTASAAASAAATAVVIKGCCAGSACCNGTSTASYRWAVIASFFCDFIRCACW